MTTVSYTHLDVYKRQIRYLVTVHGRDKYLFFEDPRWFVEEIVPDEAESAPPRR